MSQERRGQPHFRWGENWDSPLRAGRPAESFKFDPNANIIPAPEDPEHWPEFRAALASGPVDPAPAHCDLSEALLLAGQKAEARKQVLAALEIAPTYARAQELLLRIVDGKN